eukprot:533424_1
MENLKEVLKEYLKNECEKYIEMYKQKLLEILNKVTGGQFIEYIESILTDVNKESNISEHRMRTVIESDELKTINDELKADEESIKNPVVSSIEEIIPSIENKEEEENKYEYDDNHTDESDENNVRDDNDESDENDNKNECNGLDLNIINNKQYALNMTEW